MKARRLTQLMAACGLVATVGGVPIAVAAGPAQGETSGPASGSPTVPSAAVQKQASNPNGTSVAGAPGVAGKQGGESGVKPHTGSTSGQSPKNQ